MEIIAGGATDVGMVRSANQDDYLIADRLWAVADGMGGHQGGEVASKVTIEVLGDAFDTFTSTALVDAAQRANAAVHEQASEHRELRGMGTTLCAMALVDIDDETQGLHVINIGDSRCYRWRDGEMTQITRDHSLVEDLRASGQITDAEAVVHPHRNIVTRALGIQPDVEVDSFLVSPKAGDRYVICSDGLFNEVAPARIGATLRRLVDPNEAASELIRQANEGGGRDNITCVIVDVIDDAGAVQGEVGDDVLVAPIPAARTHAPDLAGITSALPVTEIDDSDDVPESPRAAPAAKAKRPAAKGPAAQDQMVKVRLRRVTWRTAAFVVVVLGVLGLAAAAVGWYSRGSYFVGLDQHEVTIFKGRPHAVLWFEPTVTQRTGIAESQIPDSLRDAVAAGRQQSSLADAEAYVKRMRSVICSDLRNGATPATTVAGATTSTLPTDCRDVVNTSTTTTTTKSSVPNASTTTTNAAPHSVKPPSSTSPPTTTK